MRAHVHCFFCADVQQSEWAIDNLQASDKALQSAKPQVECHLCAFAK